MPFKTRRQKVFASSRRYLESNIVSVSYSGSAQSNDLVKTPKTVNADNGFGTIERLDYVKKDIIKIVLTAAAVCGVQILLLLLSA